MISCLQNYQADEASILSDYIANGGGTGRCGGRTDIQITTKSTPGTTAPGKIRRGYSSK